MVVGAKVCELTDGFLWFVCGLYVGILTSPLRPPLSAERSNRCLGFLTNAALPRGDKTRRINIFRWPKHVAKLKICRQSPKTMSLGN